MSESTDPVDTPREQRTRAQQRLLAFVSKWQSRTVDWQQVAEATSTIPAPFGIPTHQQIIDARKTLREPEDSSERLSRWAEVEPTLLVGNAEDQRCFRALLTLAGKHLLLLAAKDAEHQYEPADPEAEIAPSNIRRAETLLRNGRSRRSTWTERVLADSRVRQVALVALGALFVSPLPASVITAIGASLAIYLGSLLFILDPPVVFACDMS